MNTENLDFESESDTVGTTRTWIPRNQSIVPPPDYNSLFGEDYRWKMQIPDQSNAMSIHQRAD